MASCSVPENLYTITFEQSFFIYVVDPLSFLSFISFPQVVFFFFALCFHGGFFCFFCFHNVFSLGVLFAYLEDGFFFIFQNFVKLAHWITLFLKKKNLIY